ncbi:Uncharacterized protein FWK35_00002811 [Aphis craccivora]|uniref:Uncharacterized protein n=1 Tax=Aphis craccivora TaxID=307492 RepID=A0A6G0YWM8_APHCR|nr:Uncharacterized protein FWK35_00002811 [Aphis craccivora]
MKFICTEKVFQWKTEIFIKKIYEKVGNALLYSRYRTYLEHRLVNNHSERSEECIDFTMIITSRNNAPISNYGDGFRCKSEYPWCIISFQKNREKQKKMTEKREFLRKTSFRPNRFFFMVCR